MSRLQNFGITVHAVIIFFCIALFPGCGPQYHTRAVRDIIGSSKAPHTISQDNISVAIYQFSTKETAQLFDGLGKRLYLYYRRPIYPVHCTITNNRKQTIHLSKNDISLSLASAQVVADRLYRKTSSRAIIVTACGMTIAAMTFVGAAYLAIAGAALGVTKLVTAGYAMLGLSGAFFIATPPIAYKHSKASSHINKCIGQEVQDQSMRSIITIAPGETKGFTMFRYGLKRISSCTLTLHENESQETFSFNFGAGEPL